MILDRFLGRGATKIFCIGFHKTGTSSLGVALRQLGFSVCGAVGVNDPQIEQRIERIISKYVPRYDAFQDNPWPVLYETLDERYPDSRFIFTWREPEDWIRSVVRHFGGTSNPMRQWIYGCGDPSGREPEYIERYLRHRSEVVDYFAGARRNRFLMLRITEGEGWEELCGFLNVPQPPSASFPHQNRHTQRSPRIQ
jgi:hypothetical protein